MAINIMKAFQQEPPQLDFIWPGFLAGTVGALVAPARPARASGRWKLLCPLLAAWQAVTW